MGVGESHATLGQSVEIGRVDFGFGVVAGDVAIAHVIGKNQNDVRFRRCLNITSLGRRLLSNWFPIRRIGHDILVKLQQFRFETIGNFQPLL